MGILCYLPGYSGSDRAELVARGLGSLLDPGIDAIFTETAKGPDGERGKLVTFYPGNDTREYNRELQTWMEAPPDGDLAKGRYWVGYVTAQKPSAGELQRGVLIDGEPLTLDDGNAWVIPCCEYAPTRLTRDRDTGEEIEVAKEDHRKWVEWSNALFRLIMGDNFQASGVINIPNGMEYAALTLSKNYRVNYDVVDLLEILDKHEITQLVLAATGVSMISRLAAQKKSTDKSSPQPSLS